MANYQLIAIGILRMVYGEALFPSSGGRCKKHNAFVGGALTSRHECESKKADATDLQPVYVTDEDFLNRLFKLYETAKNLKIFTEIILYINKTKISDSFVHVSTYPDKTFVYEHIKLRI